VFALSCEVRKKSMDTNSTIAQISVISSVLIVSLSLFQSRAIPLMNLLKQEMRSFLQETIGQPIAPTRPTVNVEVTGSLPAPPTGVSGLQAPPPPLQ
jgi:hypothetical protein